MIRHLRRAFSSLHMNLLLPEENPQVFNTQKQTLSSFFQGYMKSIQESKQGRIRMKESIIISMIDQQVAIDLSSKSSEDLDAILNAYYNYLGHKNGLSNVLVDQILRLAIRVQAPFKIFHLLEHHRFIGYFPSLSVLEALVLQICSEHPESIIELGKIISSHDWLPKSNLIYETILTALKKHNDQETICDLYASIPDPTKVKLSQEAKVAIIEAIVADIYREEVLFHYFVQNTDASQTIEKMIRDGRQKLERLKLEREKTEVRDEGESSVEGGNEEMESESQVLEQKSNQ